MLKAQKRCSAFTDPEGTFRAEIGKILQDRFPVVKTEPDLAEGEERLEMLLRTKLSEERPEDAHSAVKAFGAYMAAKMMFAAAVMRKESRGCFMVREYAGADPVWEKHIVFRLGKEGLENIQKGTGTDLPGAAWHVMVKR